MPHKADPGYSVAEGAVEAASAPPAVDEITEWFQQFLDHRQASKPSAHTMKAYRRDFIAIAKLLTHGEPIQLSPADITRDSMRTAFAAVAADHKAASIRRSWSTWNVLCTFLYTNEMLADNPMQLVGRPKLKKPLPKALPRTAVEALLSAVTQEADTRRTDWNKRDLALILTALLAGLRAEEVRLVDVGDVRTLDDGSAVINVKGKGDKERNVPIEAALLAVIGTYMESRAGRFPQGKKRSSTPKSTPLSGWPDSVPLFVGRDGERMTRGTLQSRIKRAFKRAGPDARPVPGALVHGLRHTYATELATSNVSVYSLMKLLGHESMTTSQRYVMAAGIETRSAAAQNQLYSLITDPDAAAGRSSSRAEARRS